MFSRLILLLPGALHYDHFQNSFKANDYIIAVDGGIEHCNHLDITPNLWVGDFDSCQPESREIFKNIPIEAHPTDKCYLDTELALMKATELDVHQCLMLGGIGGRLDHQLGLFMILIAHPHINFVHTDGKTALHSLNNKITLSFNNHNNKHLSIIPITALSGVTITGVKWSLHGADLKPGYGYSLSNEIIDDSVHYSQEDGLGWLVISP